MPVGDGVPSEPSLTAVDLNKELPEQMLAEGNMASCSRSDGPFMFRKNAELIPYVSDLNLFLLEHKMEIKDMSVFHGLKNYSYI